MIIFFISCIFILLFDTQEAKPLICEKSRAGILSFVIFFARGFVLSVSRFLRIFTTDSPKSAWNSRPPFTGFNVPEIVGVSDLSHDGDDARARRREYVPGVQSWESD